MSHKNKKQNKKTLKNKTHWQCSLFEDSGVEEYVAEYDH